MKRLVVYAAAAAVAITGATTMTSHAAVRTYVIGGNCGTGNLGNNGCNLGTDSSCFSGSGCSADQLLQMIISNNSGFGCSNNWGSQCTPSIGSCDNSLVPNLPGLNYQCPSECPDVEIPDIVIPDIQKPGTETPDIQKPDTQKPDNPTPDITNPGTQNPGGQVTDQNRSYVQQVISLVNEERAKAGLSPVAEASDVSAAAAVRAQEITRSFSHTRPDGSNYSTALDQNGVRYMGSGENIAYGQRTPQDVMTGWMNSQGHRANILNGSYTKIGVGYYQNASGVGYWVQLFTY